MFLKDGEKKPLYEGDFKPLITDWMIMRQIKDANPIEADSDLVAKVRSLPYSDVPGIEFSRYPCKIKGRVYGHSAYPYANGTGITTSEIRWIGKVEGARDVVIANTRSGSIYYLSLK